MQQGRTALAETSGSKFTAAAKEHLQQAELDKLVSLYVSQLDTLFDKAPERGGVSDVCQSNSSPMDDHSRETTISAA